MIFCEESVEAILSGRKQQTRRLVKENERFNTQGGRGRTNAVVNDYSEKTKWQVGRDYSVQLGRGKKGLWYCPKCRMPYEFKTTPSKIRNTHVECNTDMFPLRARITSIKKERLLDISEVDAKKEGYKDKQQFLIRFWTINYLRGNKHSIVFDKLIKLNPFVWVLEFEAVK